MPYNPPAYIPAGLLAAMPITHQWDDWDPYPLIPLPDIEVEELLSRVTDFGKLIFAIGCAEWVVWRFAGQFADARPWQFLDACWAYELSPEFELPEELDDDEWQGPVLGPICLALTTILNTRYGFDESNAEVDAAFADRVAMYALADTALFEQWRDRTLRRLLAVCPVDGATPRGERLPRHVLNPNAPPDVSALEQLREISLRDLDLKGNPFVVRVGDEE